MAELAAREKRRMFSIKRWRRAVPSAERMSPREVRVAWARAGGGAVE